MQVLTKTEIQVACHAAIANKTLLAFHPEAVLTDTTRKTVLCQYHINNYRCSIGTVLNEESLAKIDELNLNDTSLQTLITRNIVSFSNLEDIDWARKLQAKHDVWAGAFSISENEKAQAAFISHLNDLEDLSW
jgi:hypothetical protein